MRFWVLILVTTGVMAGQALPVPVVNYNYFAESGVAYDYFGKVPASTTGFGIRIGNSNCFSVTDVDTPVNQPNVDYATLRTALECVVAESGLFNFSALGLAGVTTNGNVTSASFGGGAGLGYDLGKLLSKGKFGLIVDFQFRIVAVPNVAANAVRPTYGVMFRKTF